MNRQDIRNSAGMRIGYIEVDSYGRQTIHDSNGMRLGYYEPKDNTTYTHNGRKVGTGNLLATLLSR